MTLIATMLTPAKLTLRPIWRRGWAKLERRLAPVTDKVAALEREVRATRDLAIEEADRANRLAAALGDVSARAEALAAKAGADVASIDGERLLPLETAWRQHVPAFLNAVSSVRAFGFELSAQRGTMASNAARHDAAVADIRRTAAEHETATGAGLEAIRTELQAAVGNMASDVQTLRAELRQADGARHAQIDVVTSEIERAFAAIDQARAAALAEAQAAAASLRTELEAHISASRQDAVAAVQDRLEFVRREIMFETLHGAGGGARSTASVPGRVLAPAKLAAAGNRLRLNVGCGHIPEDGYINVDQRDLPGVDIVAEAGDIPVEPGSASELRSSHLLEHFPEEALRRRLLPYWRSLLAPGAMFRAIVPDGETMLAQVAAGTYSFEEFREVLFGAQDYAGDFHYNLYTPASLSALLAEADFRDIEIPVRARRNGKCFEFEITAVRA